MCETQAILFEWHIWVIWDCCGAVEWTLALLPLQYKACSTMGACNCSGEAPSKLLEVALVAHLWDAIHVAWQTAWSRWRQVDLISLIATAEWQMWCWKATGSSWDALACRLVDRPLFQRRSPNFNNLLRYWKILKDGKKFTQCRNDGLERK